MTISLQQSTCAIQSDVAVTGSKSETNRFLLLQALYPSIVLDNTSNSDDSEVMTQALATQEHTIDIHHAGTAMRFLTAYFAIQSGKTVVLTGSSRMKERPIQILVEALNQLGATITYTEKEGFPPIKIVGRQLWNNQIKMKANVSSQYISALLLIAPKLENGLELTLEGDITSVPYIKMTLGLLHEIGVCTRFEGNKITVLPMSNIENQVRGLVESDWSSASYFYSIVALSKIGTQIKLTSYKKHSLQGDSALAQIYLHFGVTTTFENESILLSKVGAPSIVDLNLDLNNCPDIAQTIVVTCFGLSMGCTLTGLHTLKIKETDRLEALKAELTKFGASVRVSNDSLWLEAHSGSIVSGATVATYNDHRMAMAFAPLALKVPFIIENADVVSKSFPDFWTDLAKIGFNFDRV
ncbi:3-phosphoshikimate 1-carboxyvinyltransferase [Flavobacterium branchiophilum NBRC 15030 = ATCC 35035]|uniref:3-phosphoshikimate 1-carboxyvinyltransferase n=1 Tax=Flavobacterium branchiophilum TaxID=55197 RepID=A0A543G1S4_9FLAO|nr:3-phosphoshikimate 1-carboxyvinyltransferase [Flavobacterium branchiophilum]OXA77793.1 3-phosphoshikimate 1-carboxyvinyltransferase [Flavobacterium branchiophilum NBRC 15030 = ATCC 35035]TQM40046.1 3-phosphoshikimate 1-carboxyvinyltransferase [Flavobacterium branchiophilum]GEM56011.1 3-phosphoshikimate 1-carboxyvinyltransferase [Flavobacterium branchiophilum NBRC 15030 = ATCC 35035]